MDIEKIKNVFGDYSQRKQIERMIDAKDKYNEKIYLLKNRDRIIEQQSFNISDVHRKFTDEQLLDSIDIQKIELYLRQKKLNKLKDNMKK